MGQEYYRPTRPESSTGVDFRDTTGRTANPQFGRSAQPDGLLLGQVAGPRNQTIQRLANWQAVFVFGSGLRQGYAQRDLACMRGPIH
jgi:hypothetical protein